MGSKDSLYGTKEKYKQLAKKQGYESRSVFKLKEIDKKFNIIKKDSIVLDLGYWPGGWIEYCSKKAKLCIGIDIKPINAKLKSIKNIILLKQDIFEEQAITKIKEHSEFVDCVISDMMSQTTGKKDIDAYNSYSLCEQALELSKNMLEQNGNFVVKIFDSQYVNEFVKECKRSFKSVKIFKPQSSRENSKETYVICKGFIQTID